MIALHERKRSCPRESLRPRLFRARGEGQQALQALAALRVGSTQLPVAPERGADPQTDIRLVFFGGPCHRRTQVVAFGVEPLEPDQLLWSEQRRLGLLREREIEARVAPLHRLTVALRQSFGRVLADRLEHPEAWLAGGHVLRPEQAVVEQRFDTRDHVDLEVTGDRSSTVQREAADEDAEAREESLLLRAEEVVTPLDRGAQRPVPPGQACAGLGPQDLEPYAETPEDLLRREQLDAGGSEFECKGKAVQANAQLGDRVGVQLGELEVGPDVACASDEESNRLDAPQLLDLGASGAGKLERGTG